jgi:hypothetical protein
MQEHCYKQTKFKIEHIIGQINGIHGLPSEWPDATPLDLYVAFEMCRGCMDDLMDSLTKDPTFRERVRERAKNGPDVRLDSSADLIPFPEEEESESSEDSEYTPSGQRPRHPSSVIPAVIHPCPSEIDSRTWSSWSESRQTAYLQAEQHPSAYFYRHRPYGEVRRNGAWTPKEKKLFLDRLQELRGDADTFRPDWGLFSRTIPGRVGYQCSNFYCSLLDAGELTDSSYVRGEDGRFHRISPVHDRHGAKYRKEMNLMFCVPEHLAAEVGHIEEVELFQSGSLPADGDPDAMPATRYEQWAAESPLVGAIDQITGDVMRVPAISPGGSILDYNTWVRALAKNPVDPFTQTKLTKRKLVILTPENIGDYWDAVVKWTRRDGSE